MNETSLSLAQIAQMTMLTQRTLHNYMKRGLLHGEKTAAGWRFSADDFSQFMEEPFVKAAIRSKHLSMAEDFLHRRIPTSGEVCMVYDLAVVTPDLCQTLISLCRSYPAVRMAYYQTQSAARLTLRGEISQVCNYLCQLQANKQL